MLLFLSLHTQATIIDTFGERTTFLSATGATRATGPLPNLGGVGPTTVGDVTFSKAPPSSGFWIGGTSFDWTPINPGNDIAVDGIENLNVDLANSVFALGFDFVEPSVDCAVPPDLCRDSTFEVTILDG